MLPITFFNSINIDFFSFNVLCGFCGYCTPEIFIEIRPVEDVVSIASKSLLPADDDYITIAALTDAYR